MIKVSFLKDKDDKINGFEIDNHGRDIVCSAVSILSLNTINSLEAFTEVPFEVDYNPEGGFLKCVLKEQCAKSELLINSLELGLKGIEMEYAEDIFIKYKI
ncbi:MAG: ribosomal-processing cysteine protease Prp [bacterium]